MPQQPESPRAASLVRRPPSEASSEPSDNGGPTATQPTGGTPGPTVSEDEAILAEYNAAIAANPDLAPVPRTQEEWEDFDRLLAENPELAASVPAKQKAFYKSKDKWECGHENDPMLTDIERDEGDDEILINDVKGICPDCMAKWGRLEGTATSSDAPPQDPPSYGEAWEGERAQNPSLAYQVQQQLRVDVDSESDYGDDDDDESPPNRPSGSIRRIKSGDTFKGSDDSESTGRTIFYDAKEYPSDNDDDDDHHGPRLQRRYNREGRDDQDDSPPSWRPIFRKDNPFDDDEDEEYGSVAVPPRNPNRRS
ncbi:hypothetical protein AJ80_06485 [Polytolypa hystricis UAMH7299]|uniref:Uncharacterized protein n=1 Tax=Polytolypa hystricis (strain UAMH7299) TaxID=1447883 RepID=A0A2B7XW58_POLH7|nr:hypothetical protein AJ80_06485 [Polytolypa hystricis UAMH7299]